MRAASSRVAGNKIRVQVSFKNVPDGQPVVGRRLQIKIHVTLGIDHDCFAFRSEHVRSMGQTAEIKLFEVHNPSRRAQRSSLTKISS